jgi:hypothetical protein
LVRQVDRHKTNASGRLIPLFLAAGLLGASCSGGTGGSETTTSPAPTTAAPTTAGPTTTAASSVTTAPVLPNMKPDEIAIRNLLDVFAYESTAAYESPDPGRSTLLAIMTGEFKAHTIQRLSQLQGEGVYFRRDGGGVSPHITLSVEFQGAATATAFECWVDDLVPYSKTDANAPKPEIVRISYKTTVVREADAQWRITSQEEQTKSTTAASCRDF